MSQHPSLRMDSVGVKHRNVLSRLERIKKLKEDNKWKGRVSIYGLPKIKSQKIKVKKVKEVKAAVAGAEPTAGAQTAPAPAAPKAGAGEKAAKGKT